MMRYKPYLFIACLIIIFFQLLSAEETKVPELLLKHLELDLKLDYEKGEIDGSAILIIQNTGDETLDQIPLQLGRLMTVTSVTQITGNEPGKPIKFTQDVIRYSDWDKMQVNQIYVSLDNDLNSKQSIVIKISYEGVLVGYAETGMLYVQDHINKDFTIIREDAFAFPKLAIPSIKQRRALPREDFTFELNITVPNDLIVATGCKESEIISNGSENLWVFTGNQPVPFLNISIAPYEIMQKDEVNIYHFKNDSTGAKMVMDAIYKSKDLYSNWFGELNEAFNLNVIEIPELYGSQASLTGGIIQTADAFKDRNQLTQLYHEIAHLWHPIDTDRPSCRWNEGFAMFMQQRVAIVLDSSESLDSYMQSWADALLKRLENNPKVREIPMIDYGKHEMTGYSYRTGQLMFYLLYRVIGEESFDSILKDYFSKYKSTGSTTKEFTDFVSIKYPQTEKIFSDWLYTTNWVNLIEKEKSLLQIIKDY